MNNVLRILSRKLVSAFSDILPIILVIAFFQIVVVQKPFPHLRETVLGLVLLVIGLMIFIEGLETALFPVGERMALEFARKGNVFWVVLFGFTLGFATTIAEPALTLIAQKAGQVVYEGDGASRVSMPMPVFVLGLRITIALAVGAAGGIGVVRIIRGWPLVHIIIAGYGLIIVTTIFAPKEIIGIAYDAGGITTSTITVPLITALGVGLASALRGRNPLTDGFGLIALASLTPIWFVLLFGVLVMGPGTP